MILKDKNSPLKAAINLPHCLEEILKQSVSYTQYNSIYTRLSRLPGELLRAILQGLIKLAKQCLSPKGGIGYNDSHWPPSKVNRKQNAPMSHKEFPER